MLLWCLAGGLAPGTRPLGECPDPPGPLPVAPPRVASGGTTGGLLPLHTTTRNRGECGAKGRWPNSPSHTPTGRRIFGKFSYIEINCSPLEAF